jgi:hypothetical protein
MNTPTTIDEAIADLIFENNYQRLYKTMLNLLKFTHWVKKELEFEEMDRRVYELLMKKRNGKH